MTKTIDRIGNTLHEGSLLLWIGTGLVCKVQKVIQGGLSIDAGDKMRTPGRLVIEVELPFDGMKDVAHFQDFVSVVNPQEQQVVEALLKVPSAAEGMKEIKEDNHGEPLRS